MAETERPEIKMTKGSTKRERLEDKMIEYIDLTKKAEVDLRKDVEAMAESIRESLPKRQAYVCLHEMQGVVFWYISNQLDQQMGQPMAQQMTPWMGQQIGQNMGHQMAVLPLQQQQDNWLEAGYRNLLYQDL